MLTQLICQLIGDYPLQSSWMANGKVKRWWPAIVHVLVYYIPFFIALRPSVAATAVMLGTHLLIDRFRLAKYVAFASNFLAPPSAWKPWSECSQTGFHKDVPIWLSTWLMIIIDNTMHLTINALALAYL